MGFISCVKDSSSLGHAAAGLLFLSQPNGFSFAKPIFRDLLETHKGDGGGKQGEGVSDSRASELTQG